MSSDGLTIKERIALLKSKEKDVQDQKEPPKPRPKSMAITSPFLNKSNLETNKTDIPTKTVDSSSIMTPSNKKIDDVTPNKVDTDVIPKISIKDRIANLTTNNTTSPDVSLSKEPAIVIRRFSLTKDKTNTVDGLNPQFCRPVSTSSTSSTENNESKHNQTISSTASTIKTPETSSTESTVENKVEVNKSEEVKSNITVDKVPTVNIEQEVKSTNKISELSKNIKISALSPPTTKIVIPTKSTDNSAQTPIKKSQDDILTPSPTKTSTADELSSISTASPSKRPVSMRVGNLGKNINIAALNPFGPRPVFPSERKTPLDTSLPSITEDEESDKIVKFTDSTVSNSREFNHVSLNRPKSVSHRPPSKRIVGLKLDDIDLLLAQSGINDNSTDNKIDNSKV